MTTLYNTSTLNDILRRIESVQATSPRQWGKMDAAQMLAHCCTTMEAANGSKSPPRLLLGRIIGPIFKSAFLGEKPFRRNSPTDKSFIIADARDLAREKARLLGLVRAFGEAGEAGATTNPHAFFGPLTPAEWGVSQYKHLDHHLRQFGA
jgi:hypothetical protein